MVVGSLQLVVAAVAALDGNACQSPLGPLYDAVLELHQDCLSLLRVAEHDPDRSILLVRESGSDDLLGRAIRAAAALLPTSGHSARTNLLRDVVRYLRVVRVLRPLRDRSDPRRAELRLLRAEAAMSRRWEAIHVSYSSLRQ